MLNILRYVSYLLVVVLFIGCSTPKEGAEDKTIYVTINPFKVLAEELTCGDMRVEVLVPKGASPETFEPTARQIAELNDAELCFKVGLLDFEQTLSALLDDNVRSVDLSAGIEPLGGCCSHAHHKGHSHGIDPHIWTSPRELGVAVGNMHRAIKALYPDSLKYDRAAEKLLERIALLDAECSTKLRKSDVKALMIYHPAFTYYAKNYAIEQVAVEHEGKEPTPRRLAMLVDKARNGGVKTIFYQPQYSPDKLAAIASECGAEVVVIDPLADDILAEIERLTTIICGQE